MQRTRSFQFALAIILLPAILATGSAQAQTYSETVLHSFTGYPGDGATPYAGLVRDAQGNLYGTTFEGGASSAGTVFKVDTTGKESVLYSFTGTGGDGAEPYAGLVQDAQGNLYGTTLQGGDLACNAPFGCGTVFKVAPAGPLQFVKVTPCRLVDTRPEYGGDGPIPGGTSQSAAPQLGDCNIPTTAAAYSLNVTVVPEGPLGYLTIWPTGENQPLVSTLNSYDGRVKANAVIVPAGDQGAVSVYVTDTTNIVVDIDGYFAPVSDATLAFYPLPPCRVADTRNPVGNLGGPYLKGDENRDFPVLEASLCNIPQGAQAYSLNFTAVPHGFLGYLTVCPTPENPRQNCPLISTLNSYGGQVVANAAIVPAGTGGEIRTFPSNDTDLVIDINGYFAAPGKGGLSLYPLAPCRVLDTRLAGGLFVRTLPVNVVGSVCA